MWARRGWAVQACARRRLASRPTRARPVSSRLAGSKARFTQNNRLVSNGFSTNYSTLLDTRYTVETRGDVKLAAMPAGFEDRFHVQRLFAERNWGVWYAYKDTVPAEPSWTIRLNGSATTALRAALGIE